jgi:hypothetical protein
MRWLIHDMVVGVWIPGRQKEWTVRDHDGIKEANAEADTVPNSINVELRVCSSLNQHHGSSIVQSDE